MPGDRYINKGRPKHRLPASVTTHQAVLPPSDSSYPDRISGEALRRTGLNSSVEVFAGYDTPNFVVSEFCRGGSPEQSTSGAASLPCCWD